MAELDSVDRRVLFELSKNPRGAVAQIARSARISGDIVRYRIAKFEKLGLVIRYEARNALDRLGFTHYQLLLQLRGATEERIEKIVAFLDVQPEVTWIGRLYGGFDVALALRCKGVAEVSSFQDRLLEKFGFLLLQRAMGATVKVEYFSRDYLVGKKRRVKKSQSSVQPKTYRRLDEIGLAICRILAEDCRRSSAEVARLLVETDVTPSITGEAVSYRIRQLEREGWLSAYWLVLNPDIQDIIYCKIFMNVEHQAQQKLKRFLDFCRSHPNVVLLFKTLGEWEYEVNVEVGDVRESQQFMMELTKSHPDVLRDYWMVFLTGIDKWDQSDCLTSFSSILEKV